MAAEPGQTQPSRDTGGMPHGEGCRKQRLSWLDRWVDGWTDVAADGEGALKHLTAFNFQPFGLALLGIEGPFSVSPCPCAASVWCPNGLLGWAELGRGGMPGGMLGWRRGAGVQWCRHEMLNPGWGRGTMPWGTGDVSLEHAGL